MIFQYLTKISKGTIVIEFFYIILAKSLKITILMVTFAQLGTRSNLFCP